MTTEKAINHLYAIRSWNERYEYGDKELVHACDMAIRALENPYIEKSDLTIECLTDVEQRIFLKAVSREREICKRVDEEIKDFGGVRLVKVCNEIERKVKKALWDGGENNVAND